VPGHAITDTPSRYGMTKIRFVPSRCSLPHVPAAGSPTEDRQGYRRALAGPSAVGVCWAPIVIWLSGGLGSVFVVIPTGGYANLVVSGLVDEAVLVCYAS